MGYLNGIGEMVIYEVYKMIGPKEIIIINNNSNNNSSCDLQDNDKKDQCDYNIKNIIYNI